MTFELRFLVVALAAFTVANLTACIWAIHRARRPVRCADSAVRAATLRRLRLLPFVFSTGAMIWASLAFLLFERRHDEDVGAVLVALAAAAFVLLCGTLVRLAVIAHRSRRARRAWMAGAMPLALPGIDVPAFAVTSRFPVVAIVGVFRPTLIIARSVLATCSPEQILAIIAHERGHVRRQDNLVRLLLAVVPDILGWLPLSRRLLDAWHEAAEDAADDCAAALGRRGRVVLAEALLRVARLVPPGSKPLVLPASALYRGESIERRVRRLLAPPAESATPARARRYRALIASMLVTACLLTLDRVHDILEMAVTLLP